MNMCNVPERMTWILNALQGLVFWIGHRHSLYHHYHLAEGALVAEACNLIQANLPTELILMPECMYKNLVGARANMSGIGKRSRADLVVCAAAAKKIGREGNLAAFTKFVFEVKRGNASKQSIEEDLLRLHSFLQVASAGTRGFLLVISEGHAPKMFVKAGNSIRGDHLIGGCSGYFGVRRTVKAAASFSGHGTAHYACLVEVFRKGQKRKEV